MQQGRIIIVFLLRQVSVMCPDLRAENGLRATRISYKIDKIHYDSCGRPYDTTSDPPE